MNEKEQNNGVNSHKNFTVHVKKNNFYNQVTKQQISKYINKSDACSVQSCGNKSERGTSSSPTDVAVNTTGSARGPTGQGSRYRRK